MSLTCIKILLIGAYSFLPVGESSLQTKQHSGVNTMDQTQQLTTLGREIQ